MGRPTYFFTNFSLTMMVVCYLQLAQLATEKDRFLCEDNLTVSFLHNIDQMKPQLNLAYDKSTSLSELLLGFFHFYSSLDLANSCLCPVTGSTRPKDKNWPNSSVLDIVNPLETELNVSYNINRNAVRMFQEKAGQAAERLSLLEKAEEKGELLNEGVFWLFKAGQEVDEKRFALPRIQELGLACEGEKVEEETRPRAKVSLRTDGSYQTVQSDDNKFKARSSDKFRVNKLFPVESSPSSRTDELKKKITKKDVVKSDRIEDLKVKYLRTRVGSKFPH